MDGHTYGSYTCELKISKKIGRQRATAPAASALQAPAGRTFDEDAAVREAGRCLVENVCDSCDLCRYFCPDLCISRDPVTRQITIDYDTCKGCGICAFICPKGAITMVREE